MIDTFGRSVTYLRVSVTDLCNLRCRYCMPEDGVCKKEHADMLTEDEFIQAVEAAVALGITKLRKCLVQYFKYFGRFHAILYGVSSKY